MPLFVRVLSADGQPIQGFSGPVSVTGYAGWSEARECTFRLSRGGNAKVLEEDEAQEQAEAFDRLVQELTEKEQASAGPVLQSRFGGGDPSGGKSRSKKLSKAAASKWKTAVRSAGPSVGREDFMGPPVFEVIRLVKLFDRTSAHFFRWCAREAVNDEDVVAARRVIEAHVVRRKSGSDDYAPTILMRFEDCLPAEYECDFSDGTELPEETVEFRAGRVKIEFREFDADGTEVSGGKRTTEFSQTELTA